MNITLSRRWLGLGLALLLLAAAAVTAARLWPTAPPATTPPDQVAQSVVRAFYTVDYRDRDGWLATLRPLASDTGYRLIANLLAPSAWPGLTAAQTVTLGEHVTVVDNGLRAEGIDRLAGGAWQIRGLTVTIAEAGRWPGMTAQPFSPNVLLVQADRAWKFGAFLSDAEVQVFQQKGGRP